MNSRNLESELREVLADLCQKEMSGLCVDSDLVRELGLDSLARLRLLAGVEKRLNVRFRDTRLAELRTLAQLMEVIQQTRAGDPFNTSSQSSLAERAPPESDATK